jgi:hypothetical protein
LFDGEKVWKLKLVLDCGEDGRVNITLLRPESWRRLNNSVLGGLVYLDLPELGVQGMAKVLELEPLLPGEVEEGEGGIVTGTFEHLCGIPGELRISNESNAIGVTPDHLIWSVDRQDWVSVKDLRPGETLDTLGGPAIFKSYTPGSTAQPVYNLEVWPDHVYRVGEHGLLVHNNSVPATMTPTPCPQRCVILDGVVGPYVDLEQAVLTGAEVTTIQPNLDFTVVQKRRIRAANSGRNSGQLISDCYATSGQVPSYCGNWTDHQRVLAAPSSGRFMGGRTRPANEAQVDHIKAQSAGGSNSYCNAVLISFELNNRKRAQP